MDVVLTSFRRSLSYFVVRSSTGWKCRREVLSKEV